MSSAQASSHSHSAQVAASSSPTASQSRKRQSHNPSALMQQASPPKSEYLSDEYVLHPSVHAFKQAHPTRPMIALGHYILLQTLGEGEFGKVKLGVHSDYGVEVAIKLIRRGTLDDEQRASKVEREIEVLRQLKHPNIVRMLDVIDTAKYIGIVLEFAGGGELFDYILANRYLKEKDASRLFAQLISGVDYLHQKHIVHRDLKLENLLLDKHRNIIITDFGFANRFERDEDDLMATSCGSPCYAAPELVVTEGLYVGTAVDVWSCGVILYAMVAGYLPYDDDPANPDGDNINLLYKYIMSTPLNFPDHMSPMVKDLLGLMLVPNPQDRGTIPQIEEHQWLELHHALFERSVKEHELIFADNMIRKSQQAKRDLATRRRLQQEAKLVKALQRSQSSTAGLALNGEQPRRSKEQRHRSALPGTSTVPEYLNNAGEMPILESTEMERTVTLPAQPEASSVPPKRAGSVKRGHDAIEEPTTPTRSSGKPMSVNKNRHTIQVEYGEMAWEQGALPTETPAEPSPTTPAALDVPQASDMEIESSSDMDASEKVSIVEKKSAETVEPVASSEPEKEKVEPVEQPVEAVVPVVAPVTPTPAAVRAHTPPLPSTPTSAKRPRDDFDAVRERTMSTPKSARASPERPARVSHHRMSLPPGAGTPTKLPLPPVLAPPHDLEPAPPSIAPSTAARRASRTRKGMSLDKFGLAKLLGQSNSSEVDLPRQSYIPTSKHNKSHSMYQAPSQAATISSSTTPADVKKARRRTLQLLSGRTASPESSNGSATVAPVVGPQGIRPAADHSSQSAASMVTVDRDTEPPRAPSGNPAKRVIDWFRRKSAKDQLSTIQAGQTTGSVRTTSGGTMGRIPVHADRDRTHQSVSAATRTRVSLDYPAHYEPTSVAPTADAGPIIVIQEEKEDKEASKAKENAKPAVETKAGPEFTRQPLAPASSKANMEPKPLSGTSKLQVRTPERVAPSRSKSQRVPPTSASSPIASAAATAAIAGATGAVPRGEEGKLRLHTGLVDQSALSSRPPAEIMAEVKDVLHKMGIDVKEEAEYRLRCTRVRRRKGGPTTGLSTGFARVTAMGSSTSVNRPGAGAENRIPASPSGGLAGGLKGMLLRRGSSYSSSTMPRTDSDGASTLVAGTPASVVLAASTATATTTAPTAATSAAIQTLYGEHSIDNGDEVKFVVELCRIKNLNGLYLLSIKRLRGSVWSFKFIYQTIVERCDTLTH